MAKPDKVIPDLCRGYVLCELRRKYTARDVMLYALGLGVSQDPIDEKDLKFTFEGSDGFSPLPSFGVLMMDIEALFDAFVNCPGMPEFNPMKLLHGEEKITLFENLDTAAEVVCKSEIRDVYDKVKGALVNCVTSVTDAETGKKLCAIEAGLFIVGIGKFGGGPGPVAATDPIPNRAPDAVHVKRTTLNQALIYRLSGDTNPLHASPSMAKMGGFSRPILHGLCTFGIATHGMVRNLCDNDPEVFESISARFSSPVTPGDELKVEMWKAAPRKIVFRVVKDAKGKTVVVLSNGVATLRSDANL